MFWFFVFVVAVGWLFSYLLNNQLILYISIIGGLVTNLYSYWNSDKMVLASTGAIPVNRDDRRYREVYDILENLAIRNGMPVPKLYTIPDSAPNAFATGRDEKHSAVVVTEGILDILNRDELEGVLAHELSHIKNKDILVGTITAILVGFVATIADLFLRMAFSSDEKKHPVFLILGIVGAILLPIVAQLIHLAVSRKREYLADSSGAIMTRYPEGLASALRKIAEYSKPLARAKTSTAHLFISNPFGIKKKKNFFDKIMNLFSTHPPIEERIKRLENYDKSNFGD